MKLTIYQDTIGFDQLAPHWNNLLSQSYSDRIFSTYEWQRTWWESYQPGELMLIAVQDDSDKIVAIAPWFVETYLDERVLRSIGCVDVTDYVDLIIQTEQVSDVCRLLAEHLHENRTLFDRINLCNIPEKSPTLMHLVSALQEVGFNTAVEFQEVCPVIQLAETFDSYVESLDKKQRHELRRKLRRAEGDGESVAWYVVGEQHLLADEVTRFIKLMAASQPAKAEFLSDPQNANFMRAIAETLHTRGWLQLSFLVIEGEACACYMNFDYGGSIQVYNSGLLPEKYGHLSPGIVLLAYNIRHAIETNHHSFDFLRGNEVYKYRMGAVDTSVFMLKAKFQRH